MDVKEADAVLGPSAQDAHLSLVKVTGSNRHDKQPGRSPRFFASKLSAAYEYLSFAARACQTLSAGLRRQSLFRFQDWGNEL